MGACLSAGGGKPILTVTDGDEDAFKKRFVEDRVLGEGEFGVVNLVRDKNNSNEEYACKTLLKTAVFKDNELFAPMPPEILRGEIEMLQALAGKHFCLQVIGVYEAPKLILLVTECCTGGMMMEYLGKQTVDLRTEDVSRMSYQILDALNHCAQNKVLHRDIKPENVMFKTSEPGSELRLIDFGSGTMVKSSGATTDNDGQYVTFAGTPFYNSPEMFQKSYTQKTDVWSVGVTLYVLVAGYPSEQLQKAFNLLLSAKRKTTKDLPNMPDYMPDSYFDMLDELLKYHYKKRKTAKDVLLHDFVQFHLELLKPDEEIDGEDEGKDEVSDQLMPMSPDRRKSTMLRQQSVTLTGSVRRHSLFLDFKKFELSLTTLLATILSKFEFSKLLTILKKRCMLSSLYDTDDDEDLEEEESEPFAKDPQLDVISVSALKSILEKDLQNSMIVEAIDKLPGASAYNNHAYHVEMLKEFAPPESLMEEGPKDGNTSGNTGSKGTARRASTFALGATKRSGSLKNLMSMKNLRASYKI